jgi:hypothetical protein
MGRLPVLVCIHGLGNKPPRAVLADWWEQSIREGFALFEVPEPRFEFDLVYWADLVHEVPLDPAAPRGHPLFVDHPYYPYSEPPQLRKPSRLRRAIREEMDRIIDRVAFTEKGITYLDRIGDLVIQTLFRDLEIYYYGTCIDRKRRVRPARDVIQEELVTALRRHRRERIVLLAHSMGTIISYDVLSNPRYGAAVDALVTVGSPLGLPPVISRLQQNGRATVAPRGAGATVCRAPEGVRGVWLNFADLQDQVAWSYELARDYGPSSRGVQPQDVVVWNTYRENGKRDPHNIFGYTRTPRLASALADLLAQQRRPGWVERFGSAIDRLFG